MKFDSDLEHSHTWGMMFDSLTNFMIFEIYKQRVSLGISAVKYASGAHSQSITFNIKSCKVSPMNLSVKFLLNYHTCYNTCYNTFMYTCFV